MVQVYLSIPADINKFLTVFEILSGRPGAVLGGFWGSQKPPPSQNFLLIVPKSMDGKNPLLTSKIAVKLEDHWLW